jgi:hypothetical protein
MPVHDWLTVEAGTYHAFHSAWIVHLQEALNGGLLPGDYYALCEQHAGKRIAEVLTLHETRADASVATPPGAPAVAVADAPPKTQRKLVPSPVALSRVRRRTLTVRHVSGHRIIALIEITSPGNKDRADSVQELVKKLDSALSAGIHVTLVDLLPPTRYDPEGIHALVWACYTPQKYDLPSGQPLTLASYVGDPAYEVYVQHLRVGEPMPEIPLFISLERYVNLPLETTYQAAFRGMPSFWREVLEGARTSF